MQSQRSNPPAGGRTPGPSRQRRRLLLVAPWAATLAWVPAARGNPTAAEPAAVLTVHGRAFSSAERRQLGMAALSALPQRHITTTTPWFSGPRRFTGPLLRDVLAASGAQVDGARVARCVALNDYKVEIPMEDLRRFDVIAAHQLDGRAMTVREKGPLFVMYPFDEQPALRSATYFARCIWQLRTIELA
ncbi:MAG: molybdopterin-dependent oxidoreductase [Rubrivivax sp.]|nr:molybdopterin-dependent oxidoreductase [Rubrivivax sp.]